MSAYLDWKYLDQLGVLGYRKRSPYLANFSCVFCCEANTSSHPHRKRAYLVEKEGRVFYYCHRCGASMSASNFIRELDPNFHKEYVLDILREGGSYRERKKDPVFAAPYVPGQHVRTMVNLPSIKDLKEDHEAKCYVEGRRIHPRFWGKIHFAADFRTWVNTLIPGKFDARGVADARVVFPFYNEEGVLHAAQGRALEADEWNKYILVTIDKTIPSVYGLDSVDWGETVYVVEGPIDSLFLPNSIASIGGDVVSRVRDYPRENMVIVFDNEPRSTHMRRKMENAIELGYAIVIWPREIVLKDINDMVLDGLVEVKSIIDSNVHRGIMATVALKAWGRTS